MISGLKFLGEIARLNSLASHHIRKERRMEGRKKGREKEEVG